jgi:hypothetical protein
MWNIITKPDKAMMISIKKPVLVQIKDGYRLLFIIILTVGREPTLSAAYKIPQGSGVTRDILCTYCRT